MGVTQEFSRLPNYAIPKNYNLWLKPCLETFTFSGKVDITLDVQATTMEIELNCKDIKVNSVTYCQKDMKILEAESVTYDDVQERVSIKFNESLATGDGVMSLLFQGILNDKMKGFYRNQYKCDGETRYGAVTQFEATDARRCFPCWDEPALRATFDVSLVVLKDMVALSNTNPVFEGEYFEDSRFKLIKYATTPAMSTYLLAVVIGEYDFVASSTKTGLPVRVFTPQGKSAQGKFALNVAVKAIEYYEEYFMIKYPLPKLDLIAIADFSIGAMENWGLVTYRETALLVDDSNTSAKSKQYVSLVVCHELAHMWFGNLVTMEWWTHLWLKEGFANFMEHMATHECHPEFDIWTYFVISDHKRAKDLDALESSHPIEVPVGHPNEINEIFDAISYSKGATVIRMLHNWIGDENFRKGTQQYLTKHSYSSASTEDLWQALESTTGMPVQEVMSTWTKQMGYPVIHVSIESKSSQGITLKLTQRKFSICQNDDLSSTLHWSIPLKILSQNSSEPVSSILMTKESTEITLDGLENHWLKLNPQCYGFYRVNYSSDLLSLLFKAVEMKELSEHDRLNVQNDLFALASSGISSTTEFLNCLSSYKYETSYAVLSDLDSNIGSLSVLLWDKPDALAKLKSVVLSVYDYAARQLGWNPKPGESHLDSMLRSTIIYRMGKFGCSSTISIARKKFEDHVTGKSSLNADLRAAVYSIVLAHPAGNEFEKLMKLHQTVDLHEERVRIERALGSTAKLAEMSKVFEFAMSDQVRSNDKVFVIGSAAQNGAMGRDAAWDFVKANWQKFHDMYDGSFFIARLIKLTTENFSTEKRANEIQKFFSEHYAAAAERTVRQSLESIQTKIKWWKKDGDHIVRWLLNCL